VAGRQYKREPLADDEIDRLITACDNFREKLIVFTLLDTGIRVSELAGLTKNDIQWQEKRLVVRGKGGPYGKRTKLRIVPMTTRVARLIEHHYTMEDTFGITKRQIERIVKNVANRARIAKPVSPHVLRHTFAVSCLKRGIGTRTLQHLLGHDRLMTTEIYMNLSPEDAIREFQAKW
jgi:integrase/recombinase XerD